MVNNRNLDEVVENAANFSMSNLTSLNSRSSSSSEGYQRFSNIILNRTSLPSTNSIISTQNEKLDSLQSNIDTKKSVQTSQSMLHFASDGVCLIK